MKITYKSEYNFFIRKHKICVTLPDIHIDYKKPVSNRKSVTTPEDVELDANAPLHIGSNKSGLISELVFESY